MDSGQRRICQFAFLSIASQSHSVEQLLQMLLQQVRVKGMDAFGTVNFNIETYLEHFLYLR